MSARACAIVAGGKTPANAIAGITSARLPSTAPGLSTALQPTSAPSPRIAPSFCSPVSYAPSEARMTTLRWSSRRLEQTAPAGAVCSNLRLDQRNVVIRASDGAYDTGLQKLGAILGDGAEVGCNAVLNPGAVLGKRALVMPAMAFAGVLPPATIAHARADIRLIPRRD